MFGIHIFDVVDNVAVQGLPQKFVLATKQTKEKLKDCSSWNQAFVSQQYQATTESLQQMNRIWWQAKTTE